MQTEGKGPQSFMTVFVALPVSRHAGSTKAIVRMFAQLSRTPYKRPCVSCTPNPSKDKHKKQPGTQKKNLRISCLKEFKDLTDHNGHKIRLLNQHTPFYNVGVSVYPTFPVMGSPLLPKATHSTMHSPYQLGVAGDEPNTWSTIHLIWVSGFSLFHSTGPPICDFVGPNQCTPESRLALAPSRPTFKRPGRHQVS